MWVRSKFSVYGKVGSELEQDDVLDRLRGALMQDGEVFEFTPSPDGSCIITAAPNDTIHGIKAKVTTSFGKDGATVTIDGKLKRLRWFWWFIHVFFFLVFMPYGIVAYMRFSRSRRLAKSYGEDLVRRMRSMS